MLPVINNLLENREMALEDGRFIVSASRYAELKARHGEDVVHSWHLIPAHPDFFVIAIGLPVPPYFGNPLDPPLRSRFQARTEGMPRVGSQLLRVRRVAPGVNSAVLGRVVVSMQCGGFDVGVGRCMLRNGVLVDLVSFFSTPYHCYTPIVTCHCHHTIVSYHCHTPCYTPLLHTIVTHHCYIPLPTMAQHHFHVLHKNSRLLVSSKNCTGTKNEGSTCPISPIPGNRQTYGYLNAHPTLTPLPHSLLFPVWTRWPNCWGVAQVRRRWTICGTPLSLPTRLVP